MVKSKRFKVLIVVVVALFAVFVALVLPIMFFPLSLKVSGHIFHVGDTISGTVTFANRGYQDILARSYGVVPCTHIYNIKDGDNYVHLLIYSEKVLKAGDKVSSSFVHEFTEPGIYIVYSHCDFRINNYPSFNMRHNIVIVLE
jgi:hypothetical protein